MSPRVGDDWLAVVTIFSPALIPLVYALGLWLILQADTKKDG